jgi:hypothetical protein
VTLAEMIAIVRPGGIESEPEARCHICDSTPVVSRMECAGLGFGPVCEQCEEIETERAARDQAYEDSRSEP